ncbi:subtilisin family serine protease [Aurantimicrobium minutum]|uniref:S8 family serine peptidase n=1 Tax=Aurantimicrobium minutum TaxID=708131 RepID=UPI0024735719|nr:S8 family serine peptidase [Aurantimicrobium minutum]MDH6409844.1 subtilisin family serine protease [Aurantimicrobium minutum]
MKLGTYISRLKARLTPVRIFAAGAGVLSIATVGALVVAGTISGQSVSQAGAVEVPVPAPSSTTGAQAGAYANDSSTGQPNEEENPAYSRPVQEDFILTTIDTAVAEKLAAEPGSELSIVSTFEGTSTVALPKEDADLVMEQAPEAVFEENQTFTIATDQPSVPSWGLDRIDNATYALDSKYSYDTTGSGVIAYVVDTGINTTHSDFAGRILQGFRVYKDSTTKLLVRDRNAEDCNGHGSHVSGTIAGTNYGVAKEAKVVPVKVLDCSGSGSTDTIIAGIDWILNNHTGGPAVINLSVGGAYSKSVNDKITLAANRGFIVVVAAGNSSANACYSSPSSAPGSITVGASELNDAWASYSNYGSCVDIVAPGSGITSDYIGSITATQTLRGTSMASPHVAGAAARILQKNPGLNSAGVLAALKSTSATGVITGIPSGTPNIELAFAAVTPVVSPTATATATPTPTPTATRTPTPTRAPGRTPGVISSVSSTQLTANSATLSWVTDAQQWDKFTLTVRKTTSLSTQLITAPGADRSTTLINLIPGAKYVVTMFGSARVGGVIYVTNLKTYSFTFTAPPVSTPASVVAPNLTPSATFVPTPATSSTPSVSPTPVR